MARVEHPSLDPVWLKLDWGFKHLQSLKTEIGRYFEGKPGKAVGDVKPDTDVVESIRVSYAPIPHSIPLIICDCLQSLRSSLDFLVWQLVVANGSSPNEKNQFPICNTKDGFRSQLGRKRLHGVCHEAVAEIDRLQPYQRGGDGARIPLAILNELSNLSKHRRLVVTRAETSGVLIGREGTLTGFPSQPVPVGEQIKEVRMGAILRDGEHMKVKGRLIARIAFDETIVNGEEVCQCLGRLGQALSEEVVPRFERFF